MKYMAMAALAACLLLLGTACNAGNPPVPTAGTVSTTEAVDSTTETTEKTTSEAEESTTETESAATTGSAVTTSRPNVTAPPTKTPVTTSQMHTTAGTTGTRPFHELYVDDHVSATIKSEYVDYNREYTAADFPGVPVARVETSNFPLVSGNGPYQYVVIYLTETGEQAVRQAVEILSENPLVSEANLIPWEYDD